MDTRYEQELEPVVPEIIEKSVADGKIGKIGLLRLRHLQSNQPTEYAALLMSGELESHLLAMEATARTQTEVLLQQLMKSNPVPHSVSQEMLAQHMHSLRVMAEETVKKEFVLK